VHTEKASLGPERWRGGDAAAGATPSGPPPEGCRERIRWEAIPLSEYERSGVLAPPAADGLVVVPCGSCRGTGRDRHTGSTCTACSGMGTVALRPRAIRCAYCRGTGRAPSDSRLTCTVCIGKGWLSIREPAVRCSACAGSGRGTLSNLPCPHCKGKGMVHTREPAARCHVCRGSGRDRQSDELACSACKGAGVITVRNG
jgi:RecJ-like exonuclease